MRVIIDASAEWTRYFVVEERPDGTLGLRGGCCRPEEDVDQLGDLAGLAGIVHLLPHGGELVRRPAQPADRRLLARIGGSAGFLPEDSRRILSRVGRCLERFPAARQVLLCDTAFFAGLPEEAARYAVPDRFNREGVRRYGGDGLVHEWLWRQVAGRRPGKVRRLIGLRLGNRSSLAAIRDGRPVDTSLGFTPVEGLPSSTASGDVDPTLVFQLHARGSSLEEVLDLLGCRSGFSGYSGRPTGLLELVRRDDGPTRALRRLFHYSLVKHLGAFLAVLDGADALAFSVECGWEGIDLVLEICRAFRFMGIRTAARPRRRGEEPVVLSRPDSSLPVIFFPTERWRILYEQSLTC